MPDSDRNEPAAPLNRRSTRLIKTGLLVLFVGLAIAAIIYAFEPVDSAAEQNTLETQYYKKQQQSSEQLWGRGGSFVLEVTRSLENLPKLPVAIAAVSVVISFGCFFYAIRLHISSQTVKETASGEPAKKGEEQ
jgi:hypothetical protein